MRINEGICVQEVQSCLICGGDGILLYENLRDRLFGAPGIWTLMQCPKCHLVWLNPRPVHTDIAKIYGEYYTHKTTNSDPRFPKIRLGIRNAVLASHMGYTDLAPDPWRKNIGTFLSLIKPIRERAELSVMILNSEKRGKLLDVGCGNGQFLARMRSLGWEVMGVEPDGQAVEVARDCFDLTVHKGTLEEAKFSNDTIDVITMSHVIEHFGDPISTLKECYRVLKPLGRLVIVTPNIWSLGHRIFKKACYHLDPPRHFYLFSPHTLKVCTEQAGFQVIELRSEARSAHRMWVTSYLIHKNYVLPGGYPGKQNFWLFLGGMTFQALEQGLCLITDVGEEVVLIATKQKGLR